MSNGMRRVIETIDYKPENYGHKAVISVSFKVQTWAALVFDIFDGPILDSQNIKLDDEIPIGPNEYYTITTAGDSTIHNTATACQTCFACYKRHKTYNDNL